MIGGHVVGHEVDEQAHATLGERGAGGGEAAPAAEARVDLVAADAVGRADHVGVGEVGQRGVERRHLLGRVERQLHAGRAALPHAHQPHGVDAGRRHLVPLGGGDVGERRRDAGPLADVVEPGRRVELVDDRVGRPRLTGFIALGPGTRGSRGATTTAGPPVGGSRGPG